MSHYQLSDYSNWAYRLGLMGWPTHGLWVWPALFDHPLLRHLPLCYGSCQFGLCDWTLGVSFEHPLINIQWRFHFKPPFTMPFSLLLTIKYFIQDWKEIDEKLLLSYPPSLYPLKLVLYPDLKNHCKENQTSLHH